MGHGCLSGVPTLCHLAAFLKKGTGFPTLTNVAGGY